MLNTFFILDAARASEENFSKAAAMNGQMLLLYTGEMEKTLSTVSPYVFLFPHSNEFSDFILDNGWGNAWGIIVSGQINLEECFNHLRKFLLVTTEEGESFYFRFYDPRVLKVFLPGCDKNQVKEFFGPIEKFIAEGNTKETAIEYTHENGILTQRQVSVTGVSGKSEKPAMNQTTDLPKGKKWIIIEDEPGNDS